MSLPLVLLFFCGFTALIFLYARRRAASLVSGGHQVHSLPRFHGYYAATHALLPGLMLYLVWLITGTGLIETLVLGSIPADAIAQLGGDPETVVNRLRLAIDSGTAFEQDPTLLASAQRYDNLYNLGSIGAFTLAIAFSLVGTFRALSRQTPGLRARNSFESTILRLLVISAAMAIFVTLGIVGSLLFESILFFQEVPLRDFLLGEQWSPQTALRDDQVGASGSFGAKPLFAGTLLISAVAMSVAGPVGLFAAIYLNQYSGRKTRKLVKPMLEILAGVPTVVYGFFAAITVAPFLHQVGLTFGLSIASESALAAGLVMGIMIIPFVSSLSDDAINSVPLPLKEGSLALGATPSETMMKVVIPSALPGIVSAFLLAVSRAIGETMIVVMAAGMRPNVTANPFEAVTTVTVQIVALLTGDQEFSSAKTLSAFALGLVLLVSTLLLNVLALIFVRRYREIYT